MRENHLSSKSSFSQLLKISDLEAIILVFANTPKDETNSPISNANLMKNKPSSKDNEVLILDIKTTSYENII